MAHDPIDLKRAESEKEALEALRAELEASLASPKTSDTFVAHGKPPSPPASE